MRIYLRKEDETSKNKKVLLKGGVVVCADIKMELG